MLKSHGNDCIPATSLRPQARQDQEPHERAGRVRPVPGRGLGNSTNGRRCKAALTTVHCVILELLLYSVYRRARWRLLDMCGSQPTDRPRRARAWGRRSAPSQGYAMMHGLKLDRVFVERAVSGSRPIAERPEGGKLLAAAQGRGRDHHAEAGSDVPLCPRRARRPREAEGPGRQPSHDRPGRGRDRQRHLQAGLHDPLGRGRGRARPDQGEDRGREARPEVPRPIPGRGRALRLSARRAGGASCPNRASRLRSDTPASSRPGEHRFGRSRRR